MRVRCVTATKPGVAAPRIPPPLTVGNEYVVHLIDVRPGNGALIAIVDDQGGSGMWPFEMFEVVSGQIPSSWIAASDSAGFLALEPAAWAVDGFWWNLHENTTAELIEIHRTELARIYAEGGVPLPPNIR